MGRGSTKLAAARGRDWPVANRGDMEEATRLRELSDEVDGSGVNWGINEGNWSLPALDAKPETPAWACEEGGGAELVANPLELETGAGEAVVPTGWEVLECSTETIAGNEFPIAWGTTAARVSGKTGGEAEKGKSTMVEAAEDATWKTFARLSKMAAGSVDDMGVEDDEAEGIKPAAKLLNVERGTKLLTIETIDCRKN